MADNSDLRRMRLLEFLAAEGEEVELETLARKLDCDERTIRRDLDQLQELLAQVRGIEIRRGKVSVSRAGYSSGYFTDQLSRNADAKERIARKVVTLLPDGAAAALAAGSTPFAVARELRRTAVEGESPRNPIVFTNSLPALTELISAGISTGMIGEIYSPDDCAFHSTEYTGAFHPGVVIVGASGVVLTPNALLLYSHRAEEAVFLKQWIARAPEIIVAADSEKLGRSHPWGFGGDTLAGKRVRLVTEAIPDLWKRDLSRLTEGLAQKGTQLEILEAPPFPLPFQPLR